MIEIIDEDDKVIFPSITGQYRLTPVEEGIKIKLPDPEKKTYAQDWVAYDAAKTNEDYLFRILQELLQICVHDDKKEGIKGRKGFTMREKIFFMCFKIYNRSSLRKCESKLKELKNINFITRVPCFKSVDNFFNEGIMSKILDDLIFISAMPLAQLEETGAIDSTGFSISRFERWHDFKLGRMEGKSRVWRKAHASVGCKSNVCLSVKVTEKNVNDAVMVEKVIIPKIRLFDMKNFVADMAYSSRNILRYVYDLGMMPYVPFRKNAIGKARGSYLWSRMFEEFKKNNEEYMKKYHARSNIETTFHMIKQKFGDNLLTKSFVANENEIKAKFLVIT
jgi:transposase